MEDSDAEDISKESLFKQFQVTKKNTNESHVMQYGDLKLGAAQNVSEFQAGSTYNKPKSTSPFAKRMNAIAKRDTAATVDVRTSILSRRLAATPLNSVERVNVQNQLVEAIQQRKSISKTIDDIAKKSFAVNTVNYFDKVTTERMPLTQHDCYISATQHIHEKCFDIQNEYVLNKLWIVANLCEIGLRDITINNAVDEVCGTRGRQSFEY